MRRVPKDRSGVAARPDDAVERGRAELSRRVICDMRRTSALSLHEFLSGI